MDAMIVLFAFGLVLTGVVFLGVVQAKEEARQRRKARMVKENGGRPNLFVDAA